MAPRGDSRAQTVSAGTANATEDVQSEAASAAPAETVWISTLIHAGPPDRP